MTAPDPCGLCWGQLPPAEEWPGGICPTCQNDMNSELHYLTQENHND